MVAFPAGARIGRFVLVAWFTALMVNNAVLTTTGRERVAACVLLPVCAVALLVRRLPWFVAPALLFTTAALLGVTTPLLLVCVTVYDLAVDRRARVAVAGFAGVLTVNAAVELVATSRWLAYDYVPAVILALLALVIGLWRGSRRRTLQLLADQVEHLRIEATLREEAARSQERSRIAAEMHDVLAHRLSLIALHTGVLVARGDELPERVTDRLRLLRATSTAAMADLRDVLGALQVPATAGVTAPVPGRVRHLVDEARSVGQSVDLVIEGSADEVPTTHRLGVYRVVQEALTNVRKHAAGAATTVRIDYRPPVTTVEVTSTGGTAAPDRVRSGYGLVGLRERITALGGRLQSGPTGVGAWRVHATVPHPVVPHTPSDGGTA
ncbi:sensor histidine kinase [Micromonospora sp.]|uniref:sensor histidine kinase n=1 Tax=Micromonospora sp. TaxID=1876 RepID=UPI003B3B6C4B